MAKTVKPAGPPTSQIAFLGEAPGRVELTTGVPFTGPAGGQFDRMLSSAGGERSKVYITNVLDFQIPDDQAAKDKIFFHRGQPTKEYMDGILRILGEFKSMPNLNCVVPMGNYALWALTQKNKISNWRGSIIESTLIRGLKLVPAYHPSFFVTQGGFNSRKEALGVWDFTRALEESKTKEICTPSPEFIINPDPGEISWAVDRLLSGDHITTDTEWYGPEQLAYIGFTNDPSWAICIPATSVIAYRAYKALLNNDLPKIIHNRSCDTLALSRQGIEVTGPIEDTMIAWHACWGDIGQKTLEVITSVLTRIPFYKDEGEYVLRGDDRGQIYNCWDCVGTDEAWIKLRDEELTYTSGWAGYNISRKIAPIFDAAARIGIKADIPKMRELATMYKERADSLEEVLVKAIGHPINCRSSKQVIALVYDELGVERKERTSKQDVLMDIAASTSKKELQAILTGVIRVRQDRNIVSRYLNYDPGGREGAVDKDGRIRTNWNLGGTRGGARLSATIFGRGEQRWFPSVPMQTIPDDARICYRADDGYVFVGWDYEQAEARVVAVKTRDFDLLEDMERGIDIHTKLAALLPFNKTYEELQTAILQKGKDAVPERYLAKKCRHALNYVMGPYTFRSTVNKEWLDTGVGLTNSTASALKDAYERLHPGLKIWWAQVKSLAYRSPRVMQNFFGRVHNFQGWFSEDLHREMVSWEPQTNVADLCSLGIVDASEELNHLDPTAQCFTHMHDGGFFQVKLELAMDAAQIIKRCMTKEIIIDGVPLTIPVEIKMGPNWGQMKTVKGL